VSYTETGVKVILDTVDAEGVVAGNPLKEIVGPVVTVALDEFTERLINPVPFDPRFATP
jgi:hypothetical protein